jgi:integrase
MMLPSSRAKRKAQSLIIRGIVRDAPDVKAAAKAAREIADDGTSENTTRSEGVAYRYWSAWYQLRYSKRSLPLPVPADVIVQFIVDHGRRRSRESTGALKSEMPVAVDRELVALGAKKEVGPLSLATILHRVSMIGRINRAHLKGEPNPVAAPEVRHLLAALRRAYAKRPQGAEAKATPGAKPALTAEFFYPLLDALAEDLNDSSDTWTYRRALRDRALLLFGFATGGRRRSEITAADVSGLERKRNGSYTYTLGPTKSTSGTEDNRDRTRPLEGEAADAMKAWLQEARLSSGPIFRHIERSGRISNKSLTPESVRNLVIRLSKRAELGSGFSAHSLRSGFMTECFIQGIPMPEAMAFSGHKTVQSAIRYYRAQDKSDSPAAHLLDRGRSSRLKSRP